MDFLSPTRGRPVRSASSAGSPESGGPSSTPRARLIRTLRRARVDLENEAGGSSDDENRTPDPAATRWGTQTSESMHYLQGVNTVGALVIAFSLVFLISSASSQSTRPQQGQQQLQNQLWGSGPNAYQGGMGQGQQQQQQPLDPRAQWEQAHPPVQGGSQSPGGNFGYSQQQQQQQSGYSVQSSDASAFDRGQAGYAGGAQFQMQPGSKEECCACPGPGEAPPCSGKKPSAIAEASGTLGSLMAAASGWFQCAKMWRTKDASSFSSGYLFFALASAFLLIIHAYGVGSTALTFVFLSQFSTIAYFLWVFIKHPPNEGCEAGEALHVIPPELDDDGL